MDFTAARRRLNIVPRFLRLGALVLLLLLRLLLLLELLLLLFLHTREGHGNVRCTTA